MKSFFAVLLLSLAFLTTAHSVDSVSAQKETVLFQNLVNAATENEGRKAEDELWQYWFDQSPTPEIRSYLDQGIERREAYDFEAAEMHLDKVVEAAPEYAEGYNQRAFIRFLREKFELAQSDLEKALELEPRHFGAMSGLFHVLGRQDRHQAAFGFLQQAVTIHPWIRERSALPKDMWPESYRKLHASEEGI